MAKPPQNAGVEPGDFVYARHPKGPLVVKVLAVGRDGFTGEDGGKGRHKIQHTDLLGHKTRMLHTYSVADEGADGAILETDKGQRRFLAGEIPKPEQPEKAKPSTRWPDDPLLSGLDGLLKKADDLLAALRVDSTDADFPDGMVLLKATGSTAGPRANRPGLKPQRITDKTGRAQNRWVRSAKDQPRSRKPAADKSEAAAKDKAAKPESGKEPAKPALHKHGDVVRFRHGDVEGQGTIVASGQDGVTIKTEDQREHQVRHDALLPDHPPQPKQDDPDDGKKKGGA